MSPEQFILFSTAKNCNTSDTGRVTTGNVIDEARQASFETLKPSVIQVLDPTCLPSYLHSRLSSSLLL